MKFLGLAYFWIVKERKEETENGEKENTDHENNGRTEQTGESREMCVNVAISNPKNEWRPKFVCCLHSPFRGAQCLPVSTDTSPENREEISLKIFNHIFRGYYCYKFQQWLL